MPWVMQGGRWVKEVTVSPPEVQADELVCPECGKEYKTARGLENHLDSHSDG